MKNVFQKYADKESAEEALDEAVDAVIKGYGRNSVEAKEAIEITEATKDGFKKSPDIYVIQAFEQVESYIHNNFPII